METKKDIDAIHERNSANCITASTGASSRPGLKQFPREVVMALKDVKAQQEQIELDVQQRDYLDAVLPDIYNKLLPMFRELWRQNWRL